MRVVVVGAGAWGTAAAIHVARAHEVLLWSRNANLIRTIQSERINNRYLPGQALDRDFHRAAIQVSSDWRAAIDFITTSQPTAFVIAVPSAGLAQTFASIQAAQGLSSRPLVLNLAKGVLADGLLPHQLAARVLPSHRFASLFGPSFADEVASGLPAALTSASFDPEARARGIELFHQGAMRVYGSADPIGVELSGALKNIMAIATGVCDGLRMGLNARAALMTRGLAEIARIGVAMGAKPTTFQGLAGMGDLLLTCTGDLSRNRRVGLELAKGKPLAQIQGELGHVAEGVVSAQAALALADRYQVEAPIIRAINRLLFFNLPLPDLVSSLLDRAQKDE